MKPLSHRDFAMCRRKIAIVLTRELTVGYGRTTIIRKMLEGLSREHDVTVIRLHSLLEMHATSDFLFAFGEWVWSLLRGKPLPLQCLLYSSRKERARIMKTISENDFASVYLDTVRCRALLQNLRCDTSKMFVVTDFDDLMSRRMRFLAENEMPLLAGHTSATFPAWLRKLIEGPLARFVTRYEAATLCVAEKDVAALSDALVLTSPREVELLEDRLSKKCAVIIPILPPMMLRAKSWNAPLRFVFVGSDRLLQNRLAIDLLLERWSALRPRTQLHIYGAQTRSVRDVEGVRWHGFVEDIAEAYQSGSVLLLPGLASGGIKTKVPEAWSFGCPVLGNAAAFEGLEIADYPLNLPETSWDPFLLYPESHMSLWQEAAKLGQRFVTEYLSPEEFHRAWEEVLLSPRAIEMQDERVLTPVL